MKSAVPSPASRRQKVVDSMAKKFADRGNVEQIIGRHRKKLLRSKRTLLIIAGGTLLSMIFTALVAVGVVDVPQNVKSRNTKTVPVTSSLELLKSDVDAGVITRDQFAFYCKDFINRYDSLPARYQTPFSTTTSEQVYGAIAGVWDYLNPRTREVLLSELPYIETAREQLRNGSMEVMTEHGSDR